MVEFGRLEYLTRAGWVVGHVGLNLNDPQAYVNALAKPRIVSGVDKGSTIARFVPIDGDWCEGTPFVPAVGIPPFHQAPQGKVPIYRVTECSACGDCHKRKFECLL